MSMSKMGWLLRNPSGAFSGGTDAGWVWFCHRPSKTRVNALIAHPVLCKLYSEPSQPMPSRPALERTDRPQEVDLAKRRPVHLGEVKFRGCALPQQESREPDLSAGADDEVGIGQIRRVDVPSDCVRGHGVDDILQRFAFLQLLPQK